MNKIFLTAALVVLAGCTQPKYLPGSALAAGDPTWNNPEGRAIVKMFDEDNGVVYCVPNMLERELVEFKIQLAALIVQASMEAMTNPTVGDEIYSSKAGNTLQRLIRHALESAYPCAAAPVASSPLPSTVEVLSGEAVYNQVCVVCHGDGIAGAPKTGDKAAWAPRIAQGLDILHTHALQGYAGRSGYMPPKGARPDLNDQSVIDAVDYIVGAS